MQILLPGRQEHREHIFVHIRVDVIELRLIVVVGAVADAADIKPRPLAAEKVDRQPVIGEHAHFVVPRKHLAQHGKARLLGKERALVRVDQNGDDDLVEQFEAFEHDISVPQRGRVKSSRKDAFFHTGNLPSVGREKGQVRDAVFALVVADKTAGIPFERPVALEDGDAARVQQPALRDEAECVGAEPALIRRVDIDDVEGDVYAAEQSAVVEIVYLRFLADEREIFAQDGEALRGNVVEHDEICPARDGFEPYAAGTAEQVEDVRAGNFRCKDIEQRLLCPVGGRADVFAPEGHERPAAVFSADDPQPFFTPLADTSECFFFPSSTDCVRRSSMN